MKYITALLAGFLLFSCTQKEQVHKVTATTVIDSSKAVTNSTLNESDDNLYDYDTILKNGYHLSYRVYYDSIEKDSMHSLTLVKNGTDIRELNETNYPGIYKNLGYIGADFSESFLFAQSYGAGNPHEFQLIEKKTGKEMKSGVIVDANEENEIILYISDIHKQNEQLKIYDINTKKEMVINDFNNSKCYQEYPEGLRSCVEIDTVTKDKIRLKIDTDDEKIIKTYNRSVFK